MRNIGTGRQSEPAGPESGKRLSAEVNGKLTRQPMILR